MQKIGAKIIVLFLILLICTQCSLLKKKTPTIEIQRFEMDFYSIDTSNFKVGLEQLSVKYPNFYPIYVEGILNIATDYEKINEYIPELYLYRSHPQMIGLKDSIQKHYPNMDMIQSDVNEVIANYNKMFPLEAVDEVVTFLSEFGHKAIVYDGGVGIGLDMFLGEAYPYYSSLNIPNYVIKYLEPEQIAINVARVLAEDFVPPPVGEITMLDKIIEEGKKLYFAEQLLPKKASYNIIEYSEEQYNWCEENVFNVWSYLIDGDLLFNSNYAKYKRYVEEAPTTLGMPPESPGKVGVWVGWQIVRKYMSSHKNVSLQKLMSNTDAQEILKQSKFKPKAK